MIKTVPHSTVSPQDVMYKWYKRLVYTLLGSTSAVSRVRSLILPEEGRLDARPVDLVCDAIGKLIIYASPMSPEVKPVSNFFVYLAQNCIKRSRTLPK